MNAVKILSETQDTVTVSRGDWGELLRELEDAQDRAAVAERRKSEAKTGKQVARRDYLTAQEARRLLDGESPVKVWRRKRARSQRELAAAAGVSAGYLAEIETGRKPGSASALAKLAKALHVQIEDLLSGS
ncbi:MAG TPA: helix-turn-helix transcriptional regulator [Terriglobia bacterium]|nr:helix-turn-helix transcriptional regulator [Terriglobia bacterium]